MGRDGLELEAVNVVNADGAPAVGRPGDEHIRHGLLPRGSDGLWRYLVLGSFVIGWRTDRFVVPQWNSWGNLWESSAKLSSVIYPGGYQGKFSQVALFCNAKNVGEVTSCGVEFEDSSTPDVLNKFPNVYLLRPNNAGTNVTYDVYRMFIGQLK